jgi:malonyl-CoA O-methyltransferase
MPEPDDVAAAYDRWAAVYDTDANRTRDLAGIVLRAGLRSVLHLDVLEIGCGTGCNTEWLVDRGGRVIGLDFSTAMLRRAQARVRSPGARFVRHDVRAGWPIRDASIDVVVFALVLEHVEDLKPVFAEATRVLRPRGEVFVCELHPERQAQGQQAEFADPDTGERRRVAAFVHDTLAYVSAGVDAGLMLEHADDRRDPGAPPGSLPRILSLRFQR